MALPVQYMRLIMAYKNKEDARAYDKAWSKANKERKAATNKALYEAKRNIEKLIIVNGITLIRKRSTLP